MKHSRCYLLLLLCCMALALQAQQREHVVQRGEDFATIAKKYAITEQELMDANPTSKQCYVGRKLIIPKHGVPVERKKVTPKSLDIELLSSGENILTKSSATSYQVGQALWRKGKYDEAMVYLNAALKDGETRAYYPLGDCYSKDSMQCYDEVKALDCFNNAIKNTKIKSDEYYWRSCGRLAQRYYEGLGVQKDLGKAKYYAKDFQNYSDNNSRKEAVALLKKIQEEERAVAEKKAAEKRALAAKAAAEKREQARIRAEQLKKEKALADSRRQSNTAAPAPPSRQLASNAPRQNSASSPNNSVGNSNNSARTDLKPFTVKAGMVEMTYYPQPDGSMKSYTRSPCVYCHGSGQCSGCMYAAMVQSAVSYVFICPMCAGTRVCNKCRGKCFTESWGYVDRFNNGYMANDQGSVITSADVQAAKSMRSSSSSSSTSKSSSSSSRSGGTCSRCHGTRIDPMPNSGGSMQSWVGYYNSEGVRCTYCGKYTSHFHDRCHSCNVPSY